MRLKGSPILFFLIMMLFVIIVCTDNTLNAFQEEKNLEFVKESLKDNLFSMHFKDSGLQEITDKIENDFNGWTFNIINKELFAEDGKYTFEFDNKSFFEVLDVLLKEIKVGMEIHENEVWINPHENIPKYTVADNNFWVHLFIPITLTDPKGVKVNGAFCRFFYDPYEIFDVRLNNIKLFKKSVEWKEYSNGFCKKEWIVFLPEKYPPNQDIEFEIATTFLKARERYTIRINDTPRGKYNIGDFQLKISDIETVNDKKLGYSKVIPFEIRKVKNISPTEIKFFDKMFNAVKRGEARGDCQYNEKIKSFSDNSIIKLVYAGDKSNKYSTSFRTIPSPAYMIKGSFLINKGHSSRRNNLEIVFVGGGVAQRTLSIDSGGSISKSTD